MAGASVFVSYSHSPADAHLRREFDIILSILKDLGIVEAWKDTEIPIGGLWSQDIWQHLNASNYVVLLISPDYLASEFCRKEIRYAKGRAAGPGCRVIPILLRETPLWEEYVGELQALPRGAKPVKSWSDPDRAWKDIAHEIRRLAELDGLWKPPRVPRFAGYPRSVTPKQGCLELSEPEEDSADGVGS
jgi:hypothetical protein